MDKVIEMPQKRSRISIWLFVLSHSRILKAAIKALWHSSPFAAGIPRVGGTASQKLRRWSLLHKLSYEVMSDLNADRTMTFMNFGYAGLETPHTVSLSQENEADRYSIQLYDYLSKFCDLSGKDVLEVGCGRGGGAGFLSKTYRPGSYLGIDFAKANIAFCNRVHSEDGLRFEVGRAESLRVPDCSKDVIINVESSHSYASPGTFFKEVHRILKPGGMFLFADIRGDRLANTYQTLTMLEDQFKVLDDMSLIDRTNITKNVMRALELAGDTEVKKYTKSMQETLNTNSKSQWFIEEVFEPGVRKMFSTQGMWYTFFKEGKAEYWSYVFRKKDSQGAF